MSALFAAAETVFYCIILYHPVSFPRSERCVLKCNVRCYRVKCHRSYEHQFSDGCLGRTFAYSMTIRSKHRGMNDLNFVDQENSGEELISGDLYNHAK